MNITKFALVGLILASTAPANRAADITLFTIDQLREHHPRILASEADFAHIQDGFNDDLGRAYLAFLRGTGEALLTADPPQHRLRGMRMLQESRLALKQISTLALLYRVDGDTRYRDRVLWLLEHLTSFPDWNPQHYLDIGEMTLAVAIGLDWLWDQVPASDRDRYIEAIIEKGLKPSLDEHNPNNWWIHYNNNWNPVCHAGLVAGAILAADADPRLAERIINRAITSVPVAMAETDPDGVYPEGPTYWNYGAAFTAILIDLLDHAVGHDFGLAEHPSFRKSILFRAMAVAPTGDYYNFYDSGSEVAFGPVVAWFAKRQGEPVARHELRRSLRVFLDGNDWSADDNRDRLLALLALWYPDHFDTGESASDSLPVVWQGNGPNPIVMVKSRWDDPNAFFLGFKGGNCSISHAHMDAGSFIYEDQGVRWAVDLGAQDYLSLESKNVGIWDRRQTSDRWRIFRIGPFSHNLLLIDEQLHDVHAAATITPVATSDGITAATVDLSAVNANQVSSYTRTFTVHDNKVLRIDDVVEGARRPHEHEGRNSATLHWRMVTRAHVTCDGRDAVLSQSGKTCLLRVIHPAPSTFTLRAQPLDPPPYYWDAPNPDATAIDIWMQADPEGNRRITVLLSTDPEALEALVDE